MMCTSVTVYNIGLYYKLPTSLIPGREIPPHIAALTTHTPASEASSPPAASGYDFWTPQVWSTNNKYHTGTTKNVMQETWKEKHQKPRNLIVQYTMYSFPVFKFNHSSVNVWNSGGVGWGGGQCWDETEIETLIVNASL